MANFYVHIPFCKKACHYCNFHFSTVLRYLPEMMRAILKEIRLRKAYLSPMERIQTIYFGGGTPGLLDTKYITEIITAICKYYPTDEKLEITLEVNPDNVSLKNVKEWKNSGINRVSVGVQSFSDADLQYMNRSHSGKQARSALYYLQEGGLENLSADLIIGVPTASKSILENNIRTLTELVIPHISCYLLTVEKKTALDALIRRKKLADISDKQQCEDFLYVEKTLTGCGYEFYEISNYSKKGFQSRHNTAYWKGEKYIGVGPSAHSYNGAERQWNIDNNALYISALHKNMLPYTKEKLTSVQRFNEYIMTNVRLKEGIYLPEIAEKFSESRVRHLLLVIEKINKRWYCLKNDTFALTSQGKLFADTITVRFFVDS